MLLQIAIWQILIDVEDKALIAALAAHYRDFIVNVPPLVQTQCVLRHSSFTPTLSDTLPKVSLSQSKLTVENNAFRSTINTQSGDIAIDYVNMPAFALEYTLRVWVAWQSLMAGGVLLHSAAIVRDGGAFLFCGASGSGKTTVSRFSRELGCTVLNDDLVVILPTNLGFLVYATPFWNPTQVRPTPAQAPLVAIYRLVQATENNILPVATGRAFAELIACVSVMAVIPEFFPRIWQILFDIQQQKQLKFLHFTKDNHFLKLI